MRNNLAKVILTAPLVPLPLPSAPRGVGLCSAKRLSPGQGQGGPGGFRQHPCPSQHGLPARPVQLGTQPGVALMGLTFTEPLVGIQHQILLRRLQLLHQPLVLGSDLGDPLLAMLQNFQFCIEAHDLLVHR